MHKHLRVLYITVFLLALLTSGCRKDAPTEATAKTAHLGETFDMHVGETVSIVSEPIIFRFDSVLYDHRCPLGVLCIVAGNAAVSLSFPGKTDTVAVNTQIIDGIYSIIMPELTPYPQIGMQFPKDSYIAKFIVSKN